LFDQIYERLKEGLNFRPAVLYGLHTYTYEDIAERSLSLSKYLIEQGLSREQRVYIVLPDSPAFVWSIFGTWTAGGVLAMGNPMATTDDLSDIIDYIAPTVLITTPEVAAGLVKKLKTQTELKSLLLVADTQTGDDPEQELQIPNQLHALNMNVSSLTDAIDSGRKLYHSRPQVWRDQMACWLFTSGSTGRPKAAIHTHRDFAYNTEAYAKATIGFKAEDITVSVPRLFFGYATGTNLFFPFAVGGTTGLFSEPPSVASLAKAINLYRPSIITNVPTMLGKMLAEIPELDLSSVRFQLSAGEALPKALLEKVIQVYNTDVYDGIGSAEMFHIYCSNRPGDIKPGSLGRVVAGYELKILPTDATGPGEQEVATGETGVLWIKGDSVAQGYYRDRDKSWRTFHGHWCRSGDLFKQDADGYLYFSGRSDDLFKVNGRWMAPQEVEDCLMKHSAVQACAVIPVKINGLIKPKAYVVLGAYSQEDDLTEQLQQFVLNRIAKHKYPRTIEYVDELPKNDRGKLDRNALINQDRS